MAGSFFFCALASAALAQSPGAAQNAQVAKQDSPALERRPLAVAQRDIPGADSTLAFLHDSLTVVPPPIELTVDRGVPLRVMLKKALRIKRVGQLVQGYVMEPVYAFDRVVVPKDSEVDGRVTEIVSPSKIKQTVAYLNADFSPHRTYQVEFDTLILPDGTHMPLRTKVSPDAGPLVRLETNPQGTGKVRQARGMISSQWHLAMAQLKPSAMWRLAKSFAWSEWPYHQPKIEAGTVFDAELEHPLDFGLAVIPPGEMGAMGRLPAANDEAYARLVTPLSSATAHLGTPVRAVLTRPVFSADKKLLLPVGAELQGIVVHARPARRLHRNGQLHFALQRIQMPAGTPQPVEMALEGIDVAKSSHIKLDSEGGTNIASDKESRVLKTALSVAIASSMMHRDSEDGRIDPNGDPGKTAVAGGSGFKLIGFALGISIQSRLFGQVMGFVGAGESVYSHFITRGDDLALPKDTPIEVSFGQHRHPTGL